MTPSKRDGGGTLTHRPSGLCTRKENGHSTTSPFRLINTHSINLHIHTHKHNMYTQMYKHTQLYLHTLTTNTHTTNTTHTYTHNTHTTHTYKHKHIHKHTSGRTHTHHVHKTHTHTQHINTHDTTHVQTLHYFSRHWLCRPLEKRNTVSVTNYKPFYEETQNERRSRYTVPTMIDKVEDTTSVTCDTGCTLHGKAPPRSSSVPPRNARLGKGLGTLPCHVQGRTVSDQGGPTTKDNSTDGQERFPPYSNVTISRRS